ncbi:hypothetical protein PM082_015995 [Marasmius tenuissimus]|nr:hypothetical protein PM082_015995 [Marasmius tenuissimus]
MAGGKEPGRDPMFETMFKQQRTMGIAIPKPLENFLQVSGQTVGVYGICDSAGICTQSLETLFVSLKYLGLRTWSPQPLGKGFSEPAPPLVFPTEQRK